MAGGGTPACYTCFRLRRIEHASDYLQSANTRTHTDLNHTLLDSFNLEDLKVSIIQATPSSQ